MNEKIQSWQRRLAPCVTITIGLVAGSWSVASSASKTAMFGFACATQGAVLPPSVKQVVSGLLAKGDDRAATYGDRAVTLRLRRSTEMTYFVPLSCDGRGTCKWAIIAPSPPRSLGVLAGEAFIVKTGGSEWPEIDAFSITRAGENAMPQGAKETLEFKGDGYHRKSLTTVDARVVGTLSTCVGDKSCCPDTGHGG